MSIKKKFATAVATASLLAGLFGSAFVPSAMGAIVVSPDTVIPKYTTLTEGSEVTQAGSTMSFGFFSDDSDDTAVSDNAKIDIELWSAGAAGLGATGYDLTATKNSAVQLKAVSSNANVNIGWAYDNDTTDANADTFVDAAACSGDISVGTSSTFTEVVAGNGASAADDAMYTLCLAGETDETAATSTITVTVNGVVATTFTVTAVGPVASLTASITGGYKYVAEDNDSRDEWFTIVAKDAAGVQINGSATSVSSEIVVLSDWVDQVDNNQGDQIVALGAGTGTIGAGTAEVGYELEAGACMPESGVGEDDGDAGSSFAIKFEDATGDVVSNAVTITCTLDAEGARITAVAVEATSGADEYEDSDADGDNNANQISIRATVVDANGAPLGDGAGLGDDDLNFGVAFSGDSSLEADIKYGEDATSGLLLIAAIKPDTNRFGRFTYTITAADSDLQVSQVDGDDEVAKTFSFTYTAINSADPATISKVRNAAKTSAVFTADMGEDAAYEIVYFTVEKANGTVAEYGRRANAIGVAKLTLNRRNTTVYVYASEVDDTDVIKCVFK